MVLEIFLHTIAGAVLGIGPYALRKGYSAKWWLAFLFLGLALIAGAGWPEMWTAVGWRHQTPMEMAEAVHQGRFDQLGNYIRGTVLIASALIPFVYLGALRNPH